MPKLPDVEVIVRPRCDLWDGGGGVHLPGARLSVADEDVDSLLAQRIVSLATPENVAAIEDAIEQGLPVPGYMSAAEDEPWADPADPRDVARRATRTRDRKARTPRKPIRADS